jgi:hypothetical protein
MHGSYKNIFDRVYQDWTACWKVRVMVGSNDIRISMETWVRVSRIKSNLSHTGRSSSQSFYFTTILEIILMYVVVTTYMIIDFMEKNCAEFPLLS